MSKKKKQGVGRPADPKARKAADSENCGALVKSTTQGDSTVPEFSGAVRVARFEVGDIKGDSKAVLASWRELSDVAKEATNEIWKQWLIWHEQEGNYETVREYYRDLLSWHKEDTKQRGAKPKCDVKSLPPACSKHIRDKVVSRFRDINGRCLELTLNSVGGLIRGRKSSRGSLPGWMAILLSHESLPSSTRPLPIPFDKGNAPPQSWEFDDDGNPVVKLRVDRRGGSGRMSRQDQFQVRVRTKKALRQRAILDRILTGEYAFKGSKLLFDKNKNKWYFLLCYQTPKRSINDLDDTQTAHLFACKDHPLVLEVGERDIWIGGRGGSVASVRRLVFSQRDSRKKNYHQAGSSNKGHGRQRAFGPIFLLSNRWKDFVKTFNHTSTKRIIDILVEHNFGNIVYHQPSGDLAKELFLSESGKDRWIKDSTAWDWFQIGSQLKYKAEKFGIQVVVKKQEKIDGEE